VVVSVVVVVLINLISLLSDRRPVQLWLRLLRGTEMLTLDVGLLCLRCATSRLLLQRDRRRSLDTSTTPGVLTRLSTTSFSVANCVTPPRCNCDSDDVILLPVWWRLTSSSGVDLRRRLSSASCGCSSWYDWTLTGDRWLLLLLTRCCCVWLPLATAALATATSYQHREICR